MNEFKSLGGVISSERGTQLNCHAIKQGNQQESEMFVDLPHSVRVNTPDSHYENNPHNIKNNGAKIFTTTVMEKKKNVNFKVIKNQESNDFQQGLRNKFEKNNKIINKNDYFQDDSSNEAEVSHRIFQNEIIEKTNFNKNFIEGPEMEKINYSSFSNVQNLIKETYNHQLYPWNPNSNSYAEWHPRTYTNINMKFLNSGFQSSKHGHFANFNFNQPPSPKKKFKTRENFNYLEILMNAAEKIIEEGYCIYTQSLNSENTSFHQEENFEKKISLNGGEINTCEITEKIDSERGSHINKMNMVINQNENSEHFQQNNNCNTPLSNESSLSLSSGTRNLSSCKLINLISNY